MVASTGVAEVLLALKIAFLVLLYLFVVRVIRTAGRERLTGRLGHTKVYRHDARCLTEECEPG